MEGGWASAGAGASPGLSLNVKPVEVGQLYPSKQSARLAVETELAADGRAIKNGTSTGGRQFHVTCQTCSTWFVKGCIQKTKEFKITVVAKNHVNCAGGGRMAASVVQPLVDQLVRANPKIGGTDIKRTLKTAGLDLHTRQAQRAKKSIVTASKLDEAEAISRLPSLFEAIERDCPGSVATLETAGNRYVRSAVVNGKAANVAAKSTPKVVCLDAGHMKGGWKGVVYVLSTKDNNNRIVHVASVVSDKENYTNYKFLLDETCKNEQMAELLKSDKTTFFIDGHRGSPPALEASCPDARWNMCVRHLLTNKGMKKMGANHSAMVYKAAKMPTRALFDECMEEIKASYPSNYETLMSKPLHKWAHHAAPKDLALFGTVTSNNAESTIAMIGSEVRAKDIFHLHVDIMEHGTERLAEHARTGLGSDHLLTPFARDFMENERHLSKNKHVKDMGLGIFLVQQHGLSKYGNRIKIQMPDAEGQGGAMECTCDVPSRFRLPCQDVMAALTYLKQPQLAMTFVDKAYTLEAYRAVHSDPNFPATLPVWSELSKSDLLPPLQVQGQAGAPRKGRPQRSRFPGRNDNCQRGRGDGGGSAGSGAGVGSGDGSHDAPAPAPARHGMGSVRSQVGHLGVGAPTGDGAPAPRVWGGLAAQRYSCQETPGSGSASAPSGGQNLSQGSVDLTAD